MQLAAILFQKTLHIQLNLIRTVIELAKKLVFIISLILLYHFIVSVIVHQFI